MAKHKKLSKSSALTVPKDLRLELGFTPGIAVDLTPTAEGLLVSKHVPTCRFCGSPEQVITFGGEEICAGCVGKMKEACADA
ncbi:MAG: AbrB/MazE/SpoVT family DNA-binding domain-containing protein [Ruminococcus sp.]|nr:AbrB/MazE/SpoVT family DNA-binding domain-containing protein [Ruminococcus sp.]